MQKDERWQETFYGTQPETDTFGKNGCAIAVLAMIHSYWQGRTIEPSEILAWSENRYFIEGQGTGWDIFPNFATQFGYQIYNPNSITEVEQAIDQGLPVIVSVQPGTFTTTGHLMILAANQVGELIVYDPNDDQSKEHYRQTFTADTFEKEALNYWVIHP